jgi:5'-3' exonuclease
MLVDLIIDGNFILSKLVFTLHKNNLLFGALHQSLENTIKNYRKWYPFANIYLVSDSKEKSWRKQLTSGYKATRKKDTDIDWNFVYQTYGEFKESIQPTCKILEAPHVEGDDWISFLVEKANVDGRSTIIVSNDYDIKQIVNFGLEPLYINIMTNEMFNKEKLFLPINYQTFLNKVSKLPNDDIFNLNDNTEFLALLDRFITKYEIVEINPVESLIIKIISGDTSDNIESVWSQVKNGKKRGIGKAGAESVIKNYLSEFGELDINNVDLSDNIADLICEKKKISKKEIAKISDNFLSNKKLIYLNLSNLPKDIIDKMCDIYGKLE